MIFEFEFDASLFTLRLKVPVLSAFVQFPLKYGIREALRLLLSVDAISL